jgi:UDP-3-O-[3-hydroxymyristoyl] glucosamine N-acyltransferase
MSWTLSGIAQTLGMRLRGEDCEVTGINTLEAAGPGDISFLANPRYARYLPLTRAAAVIVSEEQAGDLRSALISANPYIDFGRAAALFAKPQGCFTGLSSRAFIHPEAELEPDVTVYPFAFVGARAKIGAGVRLFPGVYVGEECTVGAGSTLYPNSVLMAGTTVGVNCVLHAGVVLGADGFGFARSPAGIQKIPQIGVVRIGDEVEIGAHSCVDRAALGETRVGDRTKIDNLVQIGHNVTIGRECFLVSQVGISGSTKVGDAVTMAGQAGIAGHLSIGSNVTIGPQSGVARDIADNTTCGGSPCVDGGTFMRTIAVMPKLPDMYKRLKALESELADLRAQLSSRAGAAEQEAS